MISSGFLFLADSGSERCVGHDGIMHATIKEHGIQEAPLNMVTSSGESVGTLGATPGSFSFPTSDQPDTVFTHPFQIMPSSMTPIIGVDFWAKYNADKSYSRNTITIDSGVTDSKGVMGRVTIPIRTRRNQKEHAAGLCAGLQRTGGIKRTPIRERSGVQADRFKKMAPRHDVLRSTVVMRRYCQGPRFAYLGPGQLCPGQLRTAVQPDSRKAHRHNWTRPQISCAQRHRSTTHLSGKSHQT